MYSNNLSLILEQCWVKINPEDQQMFMYPVLDILSDEQKIKLIDLLINKDDDSWGVIERLHPELVEQFRKYIKEGKYR